MPGRTAIIHELNDRLRHNGSGGRLMVTAGVAALSEAERAAVIAAVRTFSGFDAANDPLGEHDFGAVEVGGAHCFWKIDAYYRDLRFGSPDPTDPDLIVRVCSPSCWPRSSEVAARKLSAGTRRELDRVWCGVKARMARL